MPFFSLCSGFRASKQAARQRQVFYALSTHFRVSFFLSLLSLSLSTKKKKRRERFASLSFSLSPRDAIMAANLASDPRRPPPLPEVSLPATAPHDSSVASTLLAATDSLAAAAKSLLPRLKPDPDNRRPPLSFTDAQSISQSRADERRRVQARREKAGKASAKAFAISGGGIVGRGDGASAGAAPTGAASHQLLQHHPHGTVSEFPGAVPEGESEKSAYWTFVQVRDLTSIFS